MHPLTLIFLAVLFIILLWRSKKHPPLPPGPGGLPIVGPLFHLANSKDLPPVTYVNWSKIHGDVFHFSTFGHHTIVLNSSKAMLDILDKRSSNYSDRPNMPMVLGLMGYEFTSLSSL
ncbi:hypothetical protein PM082_016476 [Marasmius tenuissimus]|nr:hypothetical protein PM082_016476 [Marasmius tenuissimus]